MEKEIHRLIERKKRTDLHIIGLEARIYSIETDYIRDAAPLGSILTPAGMDAYLGAGTGLPIGSSTSGTSNVGNNPANRKLVVQPPTEADRIFSNTSSSYQRVRYTK